MPVAHDRNRDLKRPFTEMDLSALRSTYALLQPRLDLKIKLEASIAERTTKIEALQKQKAFIERQYKQMSRTAERCEHIASRAKPSIKAARTQTAIGYRKNFNAWLKDEQPLETIVKIKEKIAQLTALIASEQTRLNEIAPECRTLEHRVAALQERLGENNEPYNRLFSYGDDADALLEPSTLQL